MFDYRHAGSAKAGRSTWRNEAPRPPWTDEATIRERCTSCTSCIKACPEAILISGPAGTPVINFHKGECTFCAACVDACDEAVFRDPSERPWANIATISNTCFLKQGVECRSCTDVCDARALRFDFRVRPVGAIDLDIEACTGCGACVSVCPAGAIEIVTNQMQEDMR